MPLLWSLEFPLNAGYKHLALNGAIFPFSKPAAGVFILNRLCYSTRVSSFARMLNCILDFDMPTNTTQPSPELYVFLSFAGEDRPIAERIRTFLTEAGIRVFYDHRMRSDANWDMTIERALKECSRMVLLLSSSSMPEKQEVYREWFEFISERKPIHSLLLEDCQLHSRFKFRNYIDARTNFESECGAHARSASPQAPQALRKFFAF